MGNIAKNHLCKFDLNATRNDGPEQQQQQQQQRLGTSTWSKN